MQSQPFGDEDQYESVLLVIKECFVYKIPPRQTSKGYRANEWNVADHMWTGRLRVLARGNNAYINLEDSNTGEIFAVCPCAPDGSSVEPVLDSSRYFVLKLVDRSSGKYAFIGLGFMERSFSFDFNVALQDHFKRVKADLNPTGQTKAKQHDAKPLDLSLKEGETISINIGHILNKGSSKPSTSTSSNSTPSGIIPLLPPPPSSSSSSSMKFNFDQAFSGFAQSQNQQFSSLPANAPQTSRGGGGDEVDDFGGFQAAPKPSSTTSNTPSGWTTF